MLWLLKKIILVSAKGNVEKNMENMDTDVRVDKVQCWAENELILPVNILIVR